MRKLLVKKKKVSIASVDTLWSKLVKEKAGNKCEYCGKVDGLNSHHIFSRSNRSVRWDDENGVSLCVSHHVFGNFSAHKSPIEFVEWVKTRRGEEWYKTIRRKAVTPMKVDLEAIKSELKTKLEKVQDSHL